MTSASPATRVSSPRASVWRRAAELVGLVVVFVVFTRLHHLAGTDHAQATANAITLQGIERTLGIDIELAANHWLAAYPALMQAAVLYYRLYYIPLAGVLLWVLFRRPELYPRVRNTLIAMAVLALAVYWAVPMSPPRFALPGIVDVVAEHDLFGSTASRDLSNGRNHFSAMPSMHVGWSALCAYAAWLALKDAHPRWALLVWAFPLLMVGVVITTGNHYVLDVVGTAVVLVTAIAAAAAFGRRAASGRRRSAPADYGIPKNR